MTMILKIYAKVITRTLAPSGVPPTGLLRIFIIRYAEVVSDFILVDVVGDNSKQRRLMVVALFISTLVKTVCSLSILTPTAEKKSAKTQF